MTNRTNSLTNSPTKLVSMLVVAALAGCNSTGNFLQGERIDYQSATKKGATAQTLDVPPDLSQISRDNRFSIPENNTSGANGTYTASSYNNKSTSATSSVTTSPAVKSGAMVAINSSQDMRIERGGSQRWLLVGKSPDVLWPQIKAFWEQNGFVIAQESEKTGVMETDWAENRAKIPQDIVRETLGRVFDAMYSTNERDKFRTRLERRADGSTEIYISQRGVEEVLVGSQKDSTRWTPRPNDPALEAVFLTRLMVALGATPEKAKEIAAAPVTLPAKAQIAQSGGISVLNVDEGFDRAWRRVGLALDRVGFTVEDRDRSSGIYYVRYIDQDSQGNKDGFLTKLFNWGDKDKDAKRYRILVKGESNASHVSVQNADGQSDNSATSNKILSLLSEQLR